MRFEISEIPHRGVEPRPAVSKTAMPPPHSQGEPIPTTRADDWIRASINLFTRQVPFLVEPRRQQAAGRDQPQHERKESNPARRFWRPPASPEAHSQIGGVVRRCCSSRKGHHGKHGSSRKETNTSGRQGSRTLISANENRVSSAARPTVSGYLPKQGTGIKSQAILHLRLC